MLDGLDDVPWSNLEHAYGSAGDVPNLLQQLLDDDMKVRREVLDALYSNIFHQGTRYPSTPFVIPFLIEMCADPGVARRGDLLNLWGSLIAGYFSVQERPCLGDGERIHYYGEIQEVDGDDPYTNALHEIYRESLKGYDTLVDLLDSEEAAVRMGAAWVLACLPTKAESSVAHLQLQYDDEPSGWVRATISFALGELEAIAPLRLIMLEDELAGPRCMAACQLARIDPRDDLIDVLLNFVSEPIEGYDQLPGAGGKSTDDAAFSISYLPVDLQRKAVPAICDRLDQARSFDTIPLVNTLFTAAFFEQGERLTKLNALQRQILTRMVNTEELWSIGNLHWTFKAYGLPHDRDKCAAILGIKAANDKALEKLRWALSHTEIGFLEKGRVGIEEALAVDPAVFERAPAQDECWLLCARAFAETDPARAIEAYRRACSLNPGVANRIDPTWHLADLLNDNDLE